MRAVRKRLLAGLTRSERRLASFLGAWGLFGLLASALPFTASFSTSEETISIPPRDPRAALHARSAALAAHLALAGMRPSTPLDPNRASAEELDRLPGVGPRTALRWIEARRAQGPFFAPPDLHRIEGIGPARREQMAPHLQFPSVPSVPGEDADLRTVDLNRARESELATLPRVGPVLAARIVAFRNSHGRFRSLGDLDSVPGVGPAVLRAVEGRVRLE